MRRALVRPLLWQPVASASAWNRSDPNELFRRFFVIYVDIGTDDDPQDQRSLAQNIQFAENLGAQVVRTKGEKVAEEVAKVVREAHYAGSVWQIGADGMATLSISFRDS